MSDQPQPDYLYDLVTRIVEGWKKKPDPDLRDEWWQEYESLYLSKLERDPFIRLPENPRYDFGIRFSAALTDEDIERRYKPEDREYHKRNRSIAQRQLGDEDYYEEFLREELVKRIAMQEHFLQENNLPFYERVTKGIAELKAALEIEIQRKNSK